MPIGKNLMKDDRFSRLLNFCTTGIRVIGPVPTLQWLSGVVQNHTAVLPGSHVKKLQPSFLAHPLNLRTKTSDFFVFRQIMIENEYEPLKDLRIATVLDLGANIGLASAWFLNQFPQAEVLAVEAASDNYAVCRENLAPYGKRARVLHGAAWSRKTMLTLRSRTCTADNHVKEPTSGDAESTQVQGWDIPGLIEMSGFDYIDLLKIDIEGAEAEIFSSGSSAWMGRVRNLCIELHGEACRNTFVQALADYDFDLTRSGELDICTNIRRKIAA